MTFPRTIEDQQLVLDEHGFGHHGTGAAGTGQSGERRHQMQKKNGQFARRTKFFGTAVQHRKLMRNWRIPAASSTRQRVAASQQAEE